MTNETSRLWRRFIDRKDGVARRLNNRRLVLSDAASRSRVSRRVTAYTTVSRSMVLMYWLTTGSSANSHGTGGWKPLGGVRYAIEWIRRRIPCSRDGLCPSNLASRG